ncbi:malto-oligosyltrehalose synthase [Brooklawnia cerclae]|uniref:(1->4)-alpha-D-glucan 1-alpha-D-glucosylmutase n=1 Tax=Brooklawnia cerclae TaxID=349934 RepID=A0ABX0SJW0_9ACTN|nr:malto-oligosyltrehalose synthase [Brooklawnia cerclae]NIH56966.1 (1->4)-alpha-D-glucan 1-alpha-D-glucosylmutase [Brooklawnia cerclae]
MPAARVTQTTHLPSLGRRTPVSTYRLQLGPGLTFDQAIGCLDYLDDLGVTDLYLSPILQAAPGSTHGYDVVDHTRISDVMGGRAGFERLARAAHKRGMGVIVDVVPNHMGVPTPIYHNRALWSVLKDGPQSPYAGWFDGTDDGDGILMPFLGARIGTVLSNDEITLERRVIPGFEEDGAQPVLAYYDHVFPIRAGTEQLPIPVCIAQQYYRLAYWKVASEELNFRRFFDVDTLLAVRVEDPGVFDATHALLLELFHAGLIDAFRIDHPDGLADPRGYMRRLSKATGGAWIAAEKILEADEPMQDDWPVAGTTGYDASWRIGALQVDPNGYGDLGSIAHEVAGDIPGTLDQAVAQAKREITTTSLIAEVHRIAALAYQICRDDIMLRDHTQGWIAKCVTELVVAFPRYRAYVVPGEEAPEEAVDLVGQAADRARRVLDPELHDTLAVVVDLVLGREVGSRGRAQREQRDELVVRFQQVCGAVTAKGVEDTAFYRWTHLVSLNEVGGSPATWGMSADDFHRWCSQTADHWPATMTCGTTHDTKRSEDVRSRISVLAQYSGEWRTLLGKLHRYASSTEGHTENLLWQVLAGTWTDAGPIERERLEQYMVKAAREQKIWTSWTSPNSEDETRLLETIRSLYADDVVIGTLTDWYDFTRESARVAILARKAIQLTCVGVADNYQSCETVQNYLVDPDNRQPVDFAALAATTATLNQHEPETLAEEKLHLTRQILRLRRRRPEVFVGSGAAYRPLPSSTGHVLSFARGDTPQVVTIATTAFRSAAEVEGFNDHTVVLPEGHWFDVLTGREYEAGNVELAPMLSRFPCAVLEDVSDGERTTTMRAVMQAPHHPVHPRPTTTEADAAPGGLLGWLTRRFGERDQTEQKNGREVNGTHPVPADKPRRDRPE